MRGILFRFILAGVVISGASAADLSHAPYEDEPVYVDEAVTYLPRCVHTAKRITCVKCPGARLPYGRLRDTYRAQLPYGGLRKTYEAQLPYGGLPEYCPPTLEIRQVVLVRKG